MYIAHTENSLPLFNSFSSRFSYFLMEVSLSALKVMIVIKPRTVCVVSQKLLIDVARKVSCKIRSFFIGISVGRGLIMRK